MKERLSSRIILNSDSLIMNSLIVTNNIMTIC